MRLSKIYLFRAVIILAYLAYLAVGPVQYTSFSDADWYLYAATWYYHSQSGFHAGGAESAVIIGLAVLGAIVASWRFRRGFGEVTDGTRPSLRFRKMCKAFAITSVGCTIVFLIAQFTYVSTQMGVNATSFTFGWVISAGVAAILVGVCFEHPHLFAQDFWAKNYSATPIAPKEEREEETLKAGLQSDHDRIERLKTMMHVSKKLKVARMADALEMQESDLWKRIFDWAKEFGFQINDDVVEFDADQVDAFIKKLDGEFASWQQSAEKRG